MIRRAKDIDEHTPWQEMTPAGEVYEAATARYVNTGAWRTDTPVLDAEKCRSCLLCVPFCPDSSLPVQDGKLVGAVTHVFINDPTQGYGVYIEWMLDAAAQDETGLSG